MAAMLAILLLVAIGGLVSVFLVLADMVWGHLSPVFILKEHFYAGSVLPFAVWYGRGEPRRRRAKKKSLLFLLSRRPRRVKPQVLREKSKLIQKSVDAFGAKWCIV